MRLRYQEQTFDVDMAIFIGKMSHDILRDAAKNPVKRLLIKSTARAFEDDIVKKCASYLVDMDADPQAWKQFRPRKNHDLLDELMQLLDLVVTVLSQMLVLDLVEAGTENESATLLFPSEPGVSLTLARAALTNGKDTRQLYPDSSDTGGDDEDTQFIAETYRAELAPLSARAPVTQRHDLQP